MFVYIYIIMYAYYIHVHVMIYHYRLLSVYSVLLQSIYPHLGSINPLR